MAQLDPQLLYRWLSDHWDLASNRNREETCFDLVKVRALKCWFTPAVSPSEPFVARELARGHHHHHHHHHQFLGSLGRFQATSFPSQLLGRPFSRSNLKRVMLSVSEGDGSWLFRGLARNRIHRLGHRQKYTVNVLNVFDYIIFTNMYIVESQIIWFMPFFPCLLQLPKSF